MGERRRSPSGGKGGRERVLDTKLFGLQGCCWTIIRTGDGPNPIETEDKGLKYLRRMNMNAKEIL